MYIYPLHFYTQIFHISSTAIHGLLIEFSSSLYALSSAALSRKGSVPAPAPAPTPISNFQLRLPARFNIWCVSGIMGRRLSNLILQHFAVSLGCSAVVSVVYDLRLGIVASYFKKLLPTSAFLPSLRPSVCSFSVQFSSMRVFSVSLSRSFVFVCVFVFCGLSGW